MSARLPAAVNDTRWPFYGWVIVVVCIVCRVAKSQGQNNIMVYTVPLLLEDLGLTSGELGALFSVGTVSASCVQPVLGRAVDHFGARVCVPVAQVCFCATLLCFSTARWIPSAAYLYAEVATLFFFLRALSLGAIETFSNACVQKWFVRRRGRALAVSNTMYQLGLGLVAFPASSLVASLGWRRTATLGGIANLVLSFPVLILLRRTPEVCGLRPDGDKFEATTLADDTQSLKAAETTGEDSVDRLPRGLCPLYVFTFFYALMFGGCDFYMVSMIEEAGGDKAGVDVALHVFVPLAFASLIVTPFVGELMDRCTQGPLLPYVMLVYCGFATCAATMLLCSANTPAVALAYGVVRGTTGAIYQALLASGLAFASFGVQRGEIGRVLGINQFFALAGTGFGPLVYGVAKDVFSFRPALQVTSIPPLLLGVWFAVQARLMLCKSEWWLASKPHANSAPEQTLGKQRARRLEEEDDDEDLVPCDSHLQKCGTSLPLPDEADERPLFDDPLP